MNHYLSPLLCICLLAPFMGPLQTTRAASPPLVVIVGQATTLQDVSSGLLRRAFQGDAAEYAPGKRLIPINHPVGIPTRSRFEHAILGMTQDEMARFWIDRRIRDQPPPPKTVPSAELAVRVVMSLAGAITYVGEAPTNPGVRILTIDGKKPGWPGYPVSGP